MPINNKSNKIAILAGAIIQVRGDTSVDALVAALNDAAEAYMRVTGEQVMPLAETEETRHQAYLEALANLKHAYGE